MKSNANTIREQLRPHLLRVGLADTAERVKEQGVAGVNHAMLSNWLNNKPRADGGRVRTPNTTQLEAICTALDLQLTISKKDSQ
jgi:hypothetical protein